MRVVHVLHSFATGGLEKGIRTLMLHASPGIEHAVLCLDRSGATEQGVPPGTRIVELHKPPGHSVGFLFRLARELRSLRPDVVHTRNWGGLDAIVACRLAGIRDVVHGEHGWGMEDPFGTSTRRIRARRWLSRWTREITCVSAQMEVWLRDVVRVRRPITQIYNGVDVETYRPGKGRGALRAELGLPEDAFVVTICSRLDPIKDHPTLLDAFETLRGVEPRARLVIVGDGPERSDLERRAGLAVHFLGERRDVPEILGDSDVFAMPSLNEGISNIILEAMAAGVPVISTSVGGTPELIEDGACGFLVEPHRADRIADRLIAYARDPGLIRRHGVAARARVEQRFSVASMVDAYEAVYRRIGRER